MLIPTIVLGVLAAVCVLLAYQKGVYISGLKSGGTMLLQILPLLVFAFIIAGIIPLLIPQELISRWVGAESGLRGIMIGTIFGGLAPGGPFVSLPIAAGLLPDGSQYRYYGGVCYRLVAAGIQPDANGDCHNGLEIYVNSSRLYLLLPAAGRTACQQTVFRSQYHMSCG